MLSTQLIILNYPVILSHQRSTTVSLETYPFIKIDMTWQFKVKVPSCVSTDQPFHMQPPEREPPNLPRDYQHFRKPSVFQ